MMRNTAASQAPSLGIASLYRLMGPESPPGESFKICFKG